MVANTVVNADHMERIDSQSPGTPIGGRPLVRLVTL